MSKFRGIWQTDLQILWQVDCVDEDVVVRFQDVTCSTKQMGPIQLDHFYFGRDL
jgi:hypothetical protein